MSINPTNSKSVAKPTVSEFNEKVKQHLGEARLQKIFNATVKNPRENEPGNSPRLTKKARSDLGISDLSLWGGAEALGKSEDSIAATLQEMQSKKIYDSESIVKDILELFPELYKELDDPAASIKNLVEYIFQIQTNGALQGKIHYSKDETGHIFSFEIVSENEAWIQIKRTEADKAKHGSQSKFNRLIHLNDGRVERQVGLKIKDDKSNREDAIRERLAQIKSLESFGFDSKFVLGIPRVLEYKGKKNQQLLMSYEDLGNHIYASALEENWDFKKTIHALLLSARSLSHLHSKGVLHRDIKTDNIFGKTVKGELIVKIGDFGFAIRREDAEKNNYAGTPDYISYKAYSDCFNDIPIYNSEASDRYSFGHKSLKMLEIPQDFSHIFQIGAEIQDPNAQDKLQSQLNVIATLRGTASTIERIISLDGALNLIQRGTLSLDQLQELSAALKIHLNEQTIRDEIKDLVEKVKGEFMSPNRFETLKKRKEYKNLIGNGITFDDGKRIDYLRMLRRDCRYQFVQEQNTYIGMVLEASPEFRNSLHGKTYQLIFDLMSDDGRVKSTTEIEQRLQDIFDNL